MNPQQKTTTTKTQQNWFMTWWRFSPFNEIIYFKEQMKSLDGKKYCFQASWCLLCELKYILLSHLLSMFCRFYAKLNTGFLFKCVVKKKVKWFCWFNWGVMGAVTGAGWWKPAVASRGVFILFCTASSKVHPAEVISVLYPVAGGQGSAAEGGSDLEGRTCKKSNTLSDENWVVFFYILSFLLCC